MDERLAYFLELRVRLRGRSEAVALVDRCIRLVARAETASPAELAAVQRDVDGLRSELIARFGEKAPPRGH